MIYKVEFPLATALESTLNEFTELGWYMTAIFPPLDSGGRFVVVFGKN